MRRVLFNLRGRPIYSYPALLYVGLVCGMVTGNHAAHLAEIDPARTYVATWILLVPALAGARILFLLTHLDAYRAGGRGVWDRRDGGMAMYGGLIPALLASVPLLHALDLPLARFWDVASITILTGMIFTRIGCLLNGCCSGRPTNGKIGVILPDVTGGCVRRIPTQLLEAGSAAGLLGAAAWLLTTDHPEGGVFLSVLGGYGLIRALLQVTRHDRWRIGRIDPEQYISVALAAASIGGSVALWA